MSKRPHMSISVKLKATLIALGLDPDHVDFDHDPPLALRFFDEETGTYQPDANDPKYIKPLDRAKHRDKTGGDLGQIAARKRADKALAEKVNKQAARRLGMSTPSAAKPKSKWPPRSFPKRGSAKR